MSVDPQRRFSLSDQLYLITDEPCFRRASNKNPRRRPARRQMMSDDEVACPQFFLQEPIESIISGKNVFPEIFYFESVVSGENSED